MDQNQFQVSVILSYCCVLMNIWRYISIEYNYKLIRLLSYGISNIEKRDIGFGLLSICGYNALHCTPAVVAVHQLKL